MTKTLKDYTTEAEEKYNVGGNRDGSGWYIFNITDQKKKIGTHKVRILTFPAILPQHFSKTNYKGICIGKDNHCPGCERDDEIKLQKEQDPEGTKDLRFTRNIKHLTWVVDYGAIERQKKNPAHFEDIVKLAPISHTVIKEIQKLQDDPEYAFSDFPMPYDITIERDDNGSITKYSVRPARQNTDLPNEAQDKLIDLTAPEDVVERMKEKKKKELGTIKEEKENDYPTAENEGINPDYTPF